MLGTTLGFLLLAPAAPAPAPPALAPSLVDAQQARALADMVANTIVVVTTSYAKQVPLGEYTAGAVRGMHDEAGLTPPDGMMKAARAATSYQEAHAVLTETRLALGHSPRLAGPRAYFAALNGLRHATDPSCGIANSRANNYVSVDMDFDGTGIELDGVIGQQWTLYRVEHQLATGQIQPLQGLSPIPKVVDVRPPATFPWRVKRAIPGGPAQRLGVRAGDTITHLNGVEVTAESANKLFAEFAFPPTRGFDPRTGLPLAVRRTLKLRRQGRPEPIELAIEGERYTPETIFGVMRQADGKWDCLLDREYKIGYIRVGPVEMEADDRVAEMLDELTRRGCKALILDLRWCPGGYVTPGSQIAGMFLKEGDEIATVDGRVALPRNPFPPVSGREVYRALAPKAGRFPKTPLLVLVGGETTGGGELIAAALQDHKRAEVMGQRTVGRAALQEPIALGVGDLQFRVTKGTTLRPNGKDRQRYPTSKPTDDWGVRPDEGLEVPITLDLSMKLRRWADEHAARPADAKEAVDFDDPAQDPYRTAALAYLRKKLGKPVIN